MNRIFGKIRVLFNRTVRRREFESHLKALHLEPGKMDMTFEFPEIGVLASEIGNLFIAAGGINYVEMDIFDAARMQRYTLTIHKAGQPTPHQVAKRMRTALESIEIEPDKAQAIATAVLTSLGYKNVEQKSDE